MKELRTALTQRILAGVLVIFAVSLIANWIMGSPPAASIMPPGPLSRNSFAIQIGKKATQPFRSTDPTLHLAELESVERDWYNGTGRNIFTAYFEGEANKGSPEPAPDKLRPEPQPRKAELSLKFYGYAVMGSVPKKVFLKDGDALFVAREGDVIDRPTRS